MFEEIEYEYERVNVTLPANATVSSIDGSKVSLPEGKVVAIAAVISGNTENRIIDLSVLNNNNEVVKPCDVRFSEKTAGGTFKDSMRPVSFISGKVFEARLVALQASATEEVKVQVIFMIQKPKTN
jgi:hypothetical protein